MNISLVQSMPNGEKNALFLTFDDNVGRMPCCSMCVRVMYRFAPSISVSNVNRYIKRMTQVPRACFALIVAK